MAPLYAFIAGMSLVSHANHSFRHFLTQSNSLPLMSTNATVGTLSELTSIITSNYCQLSITLDFLFSILVVSVFMLRESLLSPARGRVKAVGAAIGLILVSPVVSVSVTFPTFLAYREGWRVCNGNSMLIRRWDGEHDFYDQSGPPEPVANDETKKVQ